MGVAKDVGKLNAPENKGALDMLAMVYSEDVDMFAHAPNMTLIEVAPQTGGFGRMKTGGMYTIDFKCYAAQKLNF